jgi:SAM-dependent methyltransferase
MYLSQSKQIEQRVESLFPSPGTFLEIGCWSGENISQTAYLERERDWTGLCVDPFPRDFEQRLCQVCPAAISADGQPRAFLKVTIDRRYGGDVSYLSGFKEVVMSSIHWPVIDPFCDYDEIRIETITLDQLYARYNLPAYIDFLSVDIEGGEFEIFRSMDWDARRFGLIAFEHNTNESARCSIGEILTSHGYRLLEAWDYDDLYIFSHADWLENEYRKWVAALKDSSVHNFKEHPMVQRMLGEIDWPLPLPRQVDLELLTRIDNIGRRMPSQISGTALRMIHYAQRVIARQPRSIVEIGGGVGQFYAILRALGYEGRYFIFDLEEVKEFQDRYLDEVERQTGLSLPRFQYPYAYDFCVSFYALGEFDDETKAWYVENVVRKCPHGFVVWNPHSGASDVIDFPCTVTDEQPLLHPGNKQLEW